MLDKLMIATALAVVALLTHNLVGDIKENNLKNAHSKEAFVISEQSRLLYEAYLKSHATHGVEPLGLSDLTEQPSAQQGAHWSMPFSQRPIFVTNKVSEGACRQINMAAMQSNGVFNRLSSAYPLQCISPSEGKYLVVASASDGLLVELLYRGGSTAAANAQLGPINTHVWPTLDLEHKGWAHPPHHAARTVLR